MVLVCPKCNAGVTVEPLDSDCTHERVSLECRKCGWVHKLTLFGADFCSPAALVGYFEDFCAARDRIEISKVIDI